MAPDLNSLPPSPRPMSPRRSSSASSRRVSQHMAPPPVPSALATATSVSSRDTMNATHSIASAHEGGAMSGVNPDAAVGAGPGPLRHPRPLTAAELHLELEKEQEAVVNRLSRELSLLRQQTSSVVSNASSTSTGLLGEADTGNNHLISGAIHPTSSRRHRSSSNVSNQSAVMSGLNSSTVSGIAPAREIPAHPTIYTRGQQGRHDSSSRRSEASSPAMVSSFHHGEQSPASTSGRASSGLPQGGYSSSYTRPIQRTTSSSSSRYEEVAAQRSELESAKRENEQLRQRIRELERTLNSSGRPLSVSSGADRTTSQE